MALAGLAIALFVIAFATTRTLDLELRVVESRTESEVLRLALGVKIPDVILLCADKVIE
jgi:hypothetical protein